MKQLVLSLLAALISLPASADAYFFYTYEGQTLTYITSDDNCHVVNCNMHETTSPNVIIPEAVYSKENQRSYTVTEIQNSAFSLSTGITSVTIPATVQTIKNNAFYNCSLSSVSLPKAKTIRSHAFYNCTNLKTITFNGPIDDLQRDAFSLCPAIERIIFTSATRSRHPLIFSRRLILMMRKKLLAPFTKTQHCISRKARRKRSPQ